MVKKAKAHGTPADLRSLETALLQAREIAEGLGEALVVYFIDMSIAEATMKGPPIANDPEPLTRDKPMVSRKKIDLSARVWNSFTV
jgi:hypothetical protein